MEYLGENLLHGIECSMEKFTRTEKEIALYIIEKPNELSKLSSSQIAKKLHVSPATITRFCQKLSYTGFNEFKHELKRYLDLSTRPGIAMGIKQIDYFSQLYQNHLEIIENTFQNVTYHDIQQVVRLLNDAKKIHVYGIGNSGIAAQEFKSKFFRIGLNVETITDPHQAAMDASLSTKNSVVIGISLTGKTKEIIRAVKIAKAQGSSVIIFTGEKYSELCELSDITLLAMNKSNMHMGQNISPSLPFFLLFDLIYTELITKDYKNRMHFREKTLKSLQDN